jgi:RNA polymerase sigma-70 factor, ECF subfamily
MLSDGTTAQDVYAQLYADHAGAVLTYLTNKLRDPETAQDLAQEAWLKAHRSLPTVLTTRGMPVKAWVMRIATNAMNDHFDRVKARPRTSDLEEVTASGVLLPRSLMDWGTPEAMIAQAGQRGEERVLLALAVLALPDRARRAIWLQSRWELPLEAIGIALGVTSASIKAMLFRARQAIAATVVYERSRWRSPEGTPARLRANIGPTAGERGCRPWFGAASGGTDGRRRRNPSLCVGPPMASGHARVASARRVLFALEGRLVSPWALISSTCDGRDCMERAHLVVVERRGTAAGRGTFATGHCVHPASVSAAPGQVAPASLDLRRRRIALGISSYRLAAVMGVARRTVTEIENGYRGSDAPDARVALRLAMAAALDRLEDEDGGDPLSGARGPWAALAARRRLLGVTQTQVGEALGVTDAQIAVLERERLRRDATRVRWLTRYESLLDRLERERTQVSQGAAA